MRRSLRRLPLTPVLALSAFLALAALPATAQVRGPADARARSSPRPIDWSKITGEAVDFLSAYIKLNTTNPPGNEIGAAKMLREKFLASGVPATTWEPKPGRGIVAARLHGVGRRKKALVLLSHMDVVAADPKEWAVPPFSGLVKDGYLWGRGAQDDKGPGVIEMMAMLAIKRAGILLNRDVLFVATGDEERGGREGAGWFVDHEKELFADAGYLLNEGGVISPHSGGKDLYVVSITEKTPLWIKLTAEGPPGHAAEPPPETSVTRLVRALAHLVDYQPKTRVLNPVQAYFRTLSEIEHGPRQWFNLASSLRDPSYARKFLAVPEQGAMVRDTITPTVVQAGIETNVIPPSAVAEVDCRLLPGEDSAQFLKTIRRIIDDNSIRVDVLLNFPPAASPSKSPLMKAINELAESEGHARVAPTLLAGFTDSRYFRQHDIVAYGFIPLEVTPAEARCVHGVNERIQIKELGEAIRRMAELLEIFGARAR